MSSIVLTTAMPLQMYLASESAETNPVRLNTRARLISDAACVATLGATPLRPVTHIVCVRCWKRAHSPKPASSSSARQRLQSFKERHLSFLVPFSTQLLKNIFSIVVKTFHALNIISLSFYVVVQTVATSNRSK
jgi:hypothetical protein